MDASDITRSELDFESVAAKALAFTVAVAWNNSISAVVKNQINPDDPNSVYSTVLYAGLITLAVIVIACVLRHTQAEMYSRARSRNGTDIKISAPSYTGHGRAG